MKFALVLITLVLLCGCDSTHGPTIDKAAELANQLTYFKDTRTGLCYAAVQSMTNGGFMVTSITNVPCKTNPGFVVDGDTK